MSLSSVNAADAAQPQQTNVALHSASAWTKGDRVLAPWEPNILYPGKIVRIKDHEALVKFEPAGAASLGLAGTLGRPHLFGTRHRPLRRLDTRRHLSAGLFLLPAVFVDLLFMIEVVAEHCEHVCQA